jgi:Protein of unknown function (DUF2490)
MRVCLRIHSLGEREHSPDRRGDQIAGANRRQAECRGPRWSRNCCVLLLFVLAAHPLHAAPACDQTGVQTWETIEADHALSNKTELFMEGALRTDCGLSDIYPYYQRAEAGFSLQPLAHLQVRPYYFLQINQPGVKRKHVINLEINANDFSLHHWIVADTNRFEEDFQPSGDTTRYTNELQVSRPVRPDGLRLEPYVKGRAKYDLKSLGLVYTRLYVGVKKPLTRKLSLDGYYVRQFGAHLEPGIVNGIGVTVKLQF